MFFDFLNLFIGSLMMQRKVFLLMGMLLLGFSIFSKGSITYALDQFKYREF